MSDAYRTSAFPCPVCKNATLRDFHGRLVCDECQGMQLATDDFAQSIREIDGSKDDLAISDGTRSGAHCPQCSLEMTTCTMHQGALEIAGNVLHCATHGVWVPRDTMTAAYARASRRGGFKGLGRTASAHGFATGGAASNIGTNIANMPNAHGGMSSAMAGIANAFGGGASASAGLAISQPHYRPLAHTLYVSAHKDRTLACPGCKAALAYQGDRWGCSACRGLYVETEALVAMVREMALSAWDMPATTGKLGDRACAICESPMIVELLEGVTIDRCEAHGVYFDEHELEQTLLHASAPPHGLGAWVKQLFTRKR